MLPTDTLETSLGYRFRDAGLLRQALTHPSCVHENRTPGIDNQRLEFLGDAVLQLVVSEEVYRTWPEAQEGQLTQRRSSLVTRNTLAQLAEILDLGDFLILGRGEERNRGRTKTSNLADSLEAIFGAIFLDGGWEAARATVRTLIQRLPEAFDPAGPEGQLNPKGALQEFLQGRAGAAPEYAVVEQSGPDHARVFVCAAMWQGQEIGRGEGASKKEAESHAARAALARLRAASAPPPAF